jgi:hypothetical protein
MSVERLELSTNGLKDRCSAIELHIIPIYRVDRLETRFFEPNVGVNSGG